MSHDFQTGARQHVTREFYQTVRQVLADGELTATELGQLKAAAMADGEVTRTERALIASLDQVEVQEALNKMPAQPEGLEVFLSFSLDLDHSTLELDGNLLDLAQDPGLQTRRDFANQHTHLQARLDQLNSQRHAVLEQPDTPEKREQLQALEQERFALQSSLMDKQSQVLTSQLVATGPQGWQSLASHDTVSKVLRNTAQEAEAVAQVLLQTQTGTDQELSLASLNLDQGHNQVYALLLAFGHQPDEQNAVEQLASLLHDLRVGRLDVLQAQQAETQAALQQFGLSLSPEGVLSNLRTGVEIQGESLVALSETTSAVKNSFAVQGPNRAFTAENRSLGGFLGRLSSNTSLFGELGRARQDLTGRTEKLTREQNTMRRMIGRVKQEMPEVQAQITAARIQIQQSETWRQVFRPEHLGNLDDFVRSLGEPGRVEAYNQALAEQGAAIHVSPADGTVTYTLQNRPVDARAFFVRLTHISTELQSRGQEALLRFQSGQASLANMQQQLDTQSQVVSDLSEQVSGLQADYRRLIAEAADSLQELLRLKADPGFWESLSPDLKALLEVQVRRLQQETDLAPALLAQSTQALQRALELLAEAGELSLAAQELALGLAELLNQLQAAQSGLQQSTQAHAKLEILNHQAAKLSERLSVFPNPALSASQMVSELELLLRELQREIAALQQTRFEKSAWEAQLSQDNLQRMNSQLAYHQAQLQRYDQLAEAQLTELLKDTLLAAQDVLQSAR